MPVPLGPRQAWATPSFSENELLEVRSATEQRPEPGLEPGGPHSQVGLAGSVGEVPSEAKCAEESQKHLHMSENHVDL